MDAITTLLFKYPPRVFARGDMVTAPVVPVLLLIIAAAVAVLIVTVAYARVRTLRPLDRAVLGTLRVLAVLLVIGCLLRPGIVIASAVPQRNVLAVLVDDSRSMRIGDVDGATRAAAVQGVFADTASLSRRLGERFALRRFRFAARAEPLASVAGLTSKGTRSDLAHALDDVREELSGMPLAGVVLVSDGADNGNSAYADALLALRARRVPVYTVGVGREQFERDLAIDRVVAPQRALAGAAILIEADVRTRGLGGDPATVTVEADGRVIATETVRAPERGDVAHIRVRVPPLPAGTYRLAVRAKPLANEIVTENNAWQASLDVRAGPDRILYIEGEPRPEFSFMRRAVANDSGVQIVGLMRSAERKFLRLGVRDSLDLLGGFPTSREELFSYRAIIIGSIEASFFTADQLRMIADFVSQRGGGLLVLGGRASLSEGGFAGTPLAEVLPLTLTRGEVNLEGPATTVSVRPTRPGQIHPALQLRGTLPASIARWDSLPPLTTVNQIGALRAGATVLLAGRTDGGRSDVPILSYQRYGRGTSAVFAAQDSWHWRMDPSIAVEDDTFQTFWRQLSRWLVDGAPDRLEISATPARVAPGEPVTLRAHVSNAFYNDVNNASVNVNVRAANGTTTSVPLEWSLREDGSYSSTFTPQDSGRYELMAEAKFGRDSVETSSATLLVDDQGADLAQAERRTVLLRRIADETGGKYYDLKDVERLPDDAVFTDAGVTVREAKDLWDMPAVFLTLALLLGAEWGYRRWRGLA